MNNSEENLTQTIEQIRSMDQERSIIRKMSWEEYVCHILDVDRKNVNVDGLAKLTFVLSGIASYTDTDKGDYTE